MANLLPGQDSCCDPCESPLAVAVPGPTGPAGADGSNGTNGTDAFTATTSSFTMPAEGANVTIAVVASTPFSISQILLVKAGGALGYFQVAAKPTSLSLTLTNLANPASSLYTVNSAPGTVFAPSASVVPAGLQGPAGAAGGGAPTAASYITNVPEAGLAGEQAMSALATGIVKNTTATGILSIAADGTDYLSSTTGLKKANNLSDVAVAATARTNLGVAIGTNVQAYDATLLSLAALGTAADKVAYTTGLDTWAETALTSLARTLISKTTTLAMRGVLDVISGYGFLNYTLSVDANTAGDTLLTISSSNYIIDKVLCTNASINLNTATLGIFTAAGGGGTTIAADQVLSALTASTKYRDLTLQAVTGTDRFTTGTLYARIGTPQGAPATFDLIVYARKLD